MKLRILVSVGILASISCSSKGSSHGWAETSEPGTVVPFSDTSTPSYFTMTTGNGHGFELFDAQKVKLTAFLDHPYRYLRAPANIQNDGPERRNLAEELSLGLNVGEKTTWLTAGVQASPLTAIVPNYLEQTNVIHAVTHLQGQGQEQRTADSFYFAPFGLEKNAMIAMMSTPPQHSDATVHLRFHLGANPVSASFWDSTIQLVKIPGERIDRLATSRPSWIVRGKGLGAVIYIPLQARTRAKCEVLSEPGSVETTDDLGDASCSANDLGFSLTAPLDSTGNFGVLVAYVEDTASVQTEAQEMIDWIANRSNSSLLTDSLKDWRNWRKAAPAALAGKKDELKLWRQSEAVLRMAQMREPNIPGVRTSQGMILASLSPGAWATGWVRDGTYATVALARSGHFAEAKKSLNFFLNAEPVGKFKSYVGNYDYRISVTRYFGSGEEEGDYSNQTTPNVETDGWGLFLWAARQYVDQAHDPAWLQERTRKGTVYEALREGVAGAIESQLEGTSHGSDKIMRPDSSIWEVHQQNAKHFAFTSLMAARGLCDFAAIASRSGHSDDHAKFKKLAEEARLGFISSFTSSDGYLIGALERATDTDLDTAVAEAYSFDVLSDFAGPTATKTLTHLEKLQLPTGGFSRVAGAHSYESNEWAFVDFRMASVYRHMRKPKVSEALIQRIVEGAAKNNFLIPEMYDPISTGGGYAGSIPMVGYGSGAYLLAILDREGQTEPHGCD